MSYSIAIISHDGKRIGAVENKEGIGALPWFHANCMGYSMAHALEHEGYSVEDVEDIDCHDVSDILGAICARLGVTMETEFVPFSRSRNAKPQSDGKPWLSLNWRVTFKRHGREFLKTDYAQGSGHTPASTAKPTGGTVAPGRYLERLRRNAVAKECETGTRHDFGDGFMFDSDGTRSTRKPIAPPSIGDVMQSLVREADVLEAGGFENWADDYGYDTDSRKAEAIYRACLEIALKLQSALGATALAELRLVSQFN